MFIAKKKDIEFHAVDLSLVSIPIVELAFIHPWFMCEILELEEENNSRILTPKLVPSIERLTALAFSHKILNTYLVSPSYINQSQRWSMQRLVKITRGEYFSQGCKGFVYRFELEDGKSIDFDVNGLNQNRNELTFESILILNGS